ncbi:Phospholipid:diacylglycerol acyltransferase [Arachis hypogaea]|nr:Phospholipid:diacylglycerol acyltransferase [Arachis hypogaea]
MGIEGIKAVSDYKAYTADAVLDVLHFVAPTMMKLEDAHFSRGIANNLDDPKYKNYKYWSNPRNKITTCSRYGDLLYIDTSVNGGDEDPFLKDGVYSANRDETVPVLSAGFMCAKDWQGKNYFNPSGI